MTTTTEATAVGARLHDARRGAGLAVVDLAARTRIQAHIIRDIERDDYASCRGAFYARGHVKSLAAELDLDAAPLLAELDRTQGLRAPALFTAPPSDQAAQLPAVQRDRGPRWLTVALGAAVIVVLLVVVGGLVRGSGTPNQTVRGRAVPSAAAPATGATRPLASTAAAVPVRLTLTAVGSPSWIKVTNVSGGQLYVGLLHTGEPRTFAAARGLVVRFGDQSAVRVSRGGVDLGRPSCAGPGVCSLTYRSTGAPSQG